MAIQTVSAQVRELEETLGYALLKPAGRGVQLPDLIRDAAAQPTLRLAIGVADGLPKLVVRRLMQPILAEPNLRLQCFENAFEELLANLALQCMATHWDRPRWRGTRQKRSTQPRVAISHDRWRLLQFYYRPNSPRFARVWINGLSATESGRDWWANLKIARCSRPLDPAASVYFRLRSWWRPN